ncbi:hypothetical protein [uncultured Bartonella sp.]|uniref:hypothetical protein n=1 Tax=uncultured Bartonella sp. TaxID=104108 RepID=UPI0025FF5E54|nr:hypothetical protein [uncultured Bartonella sp.]
MPSNMDIDKQNDNSQKKSGAEQKFKIIKKRFLWCGIICLLFAISIYTTAYFFHPVDSLEIRLSIFVFVVLAAMSIWFYSAMRIDTNWLSFVSSTIGFFGLFLAITFYPDQEFQRNLNIISFVGMVATLFFLLLYAFINASFFPSKNPDIRQSVDFVSNHFAVEVLFSTLIIGTLFGIIAFLYFYPDKDNSTFFGGIDIKNVALATAGLVTFFWAAKATKNKSIELEEKKQDGKRHDNEIAMAKQRDTAQLIAEASKLLSSESDAQKYAGLSFLNAVASDPEGLLRKEAFDLIADFILTASDVTIENKVRMRAIHYADDLVGNNPDKFGIIELIYISSSDAKNSYLESIEIKSLYIVYIEFSISPHVLLYGIQTKNDGKIAFINCSFEGGGALFVNEKNAIVNLPKTILINNVSVWNCKITNCKIGRLNVSCFIQVKDFSTNKISLLNYVPDEYWSIASPRVSKFLLCDFSDCPSWNDAAFRELNLSGEQVFKNCYYYSGHEPEGFYKKIESALLTKISSKKQFEQEFKDYPSMHFSPPKKNKRKPSRARKNK